MSYVLFFSDLTSLTGFLAPVRSINFVDWLIKKKNRSHWSIRNKLKLARDLKSLSRNVIMH